MKLKFKPGVILTNEGIKSAGIDLNFKKLTPSIYEALHALKEGSDRDANLKEEELLHFYYLLEVLKKRALLVYKTDLLELIPFNGTFTLQTEFEGAYQLSRFALCRLENDALIIETPLSALQVKICSPEGMLFFYTFRNKLTFAEALKHHSHLHEESAKETFYLLASANILTKDEESTAAKQWEFHDLFFHSRSRVGRNNAPFGGTFRFKGLLPSLPCVKPCKQHSLYDLSKPEKELTFSLDEVMQKRKSIRKHGQTPITLKQLGELLYRSARVKSIIPSDGEELSQRPYPGGGARYEFELYPIIYACEKMERGVYHYHPLEHQLCKVSELNERAEKFLRDAQRASNKSEYPQVLIVIAARFQRVSWKYQCMAYALILKNLGILLQTMYLVATAMELAPCAIGGGDSDLFCEVIGTNYLEECSVGEFMLGSLPS
jgi:oxazoline/thiazoline dehydrogenase